MTTDLPLGREVDYPDTYSPDVLVAIPRAGARKELGLSGDALPFLGEDIWNAWELSWLTPDGRPDIAVIEIRLPADSPNIVESKSLKLYLNSFAMSEYESRDDVIGVIRKDLNALLETGIRIRALEEQRADGVRPGRLPGICLDGLHVHPRFEKDTTPDLVVYDETYVTSEDVYTELFRSLCPVTGQPDMASVLISYSGPLIEHAPLLRYLMSYRRHQDFHEACVERIFMDIWQHCRPDRLCVSARFLRRGGIDINPWRSSDRNERMPNMRLWRQ